MDQGAQANALAAQPDLSPLEQEVLDEYERLAENMKKVGGTPYRALQEEAFSNEVTIMLTAAFGHSLPPFLTPLRALQRARSSTDCGSWSERPAWSSLS
jgi:hypothetical protein